MLPYLLALLTTFSAEATTYYLSNNGNDNHDGKTRATAWSSLNKLKTSMNYIIAGDSILLERDSIFKGEITMSKSGLYIGSYNYGAKPIISGSIYIKRWTLIKHNIWMNECTECPEEIGNIFINGAIQPLGRYPNTGYLNFTGASHNESTISDSFLPFENDYWNNAELVVKSSRWTLDNLHISKYENKTFKTSSRPSYPLTLGFGYFIQKHLATLDQNGEWFYDQLAKRIYIYLDNNTNPADHRIEASVIEVGLIADYIYDTVIENIDFHYQKTIGVSVINSSKLRLSNVEVLYSGKNGMEINMNRDICIENCRIVGSNNNGVEWSGNTKAIFTNNVISCSGIYAGRGQSGNGTYIGLRMYSKELINGHNQIMSNTIDSTGYSAIDFRSGSTKIKNNTISNFCLIKDDGGGVYTWGNTTGNNYISNNIISNGIGNGEGTNQPANRYAYGIYIDDRSSDLDLTNNNISHCATAGIFIHNAKIIKITSNIAQYNGTCINNKERGQLYIKLDTLGKLGGDINLKLNVSKNKWIADSEALYCMYLSAPKKKDLQQLGIFTQNQFEVTNAQFAIAELYLEDDICAAPEEYKLKDWQTETPYENGSSFKQIHKKSKSYKSEENMIQNGSMSTNLKGWYVWPDKSILLYQKSNFLANASLKAIIPPENTEVLLYHEGISFVKGKLYRLSFSARSLDKTKVEFTPLMQKSPWQALGAYMCFSVDTNMKPYTYYFRPTVTQTRARVNFKSTSTFWLDNVTLYEVEEPR